MKLSLLLIVAITALYTSVGAQVSYAHSLTINADNEQGWVASRIYLNSHHNYRGAGIFSLGQTNNWFMGNPYTDHSNSFIIGVGEKSIGTDQIAQKQYAKFYINSSGNVGIGTYSPQNKLDVNGTIRAKEVIVESGWADHVFADGYALLPLAEVEAHIVANRRLPGVPSAEEVAASGVSIGESQRVLLEKVEELTLYAIEQDRRLAVQAASNREKDVRIESLEARLARVESLLNK